jgi:integrase
MRDDNPVRGVIKFADGKRERRLSDDEYGGLGDALQKAEEGAFWPPAIAVARFLSLSGWRLGEALGLRRSHVDLPRRTARLADTKTGFSVRPLSHAACEVLRSVNHTGELVFPASRGSGLMMTGFKKMFARMVRAGGLPADITPQVLRHSFSSLAADLGYAEPTIAALIGHKGRNVTSRYIHSADAVLLAAADAVADRTAFMMGGGKPAGVVVELRPTAQ